MEHLKFGDMAAIHMANLSAELAEFSRLICYLPHLVPENYKSANWFAKFR